MKKAVVLVSGGLDSTTTLALAQRQCFALYALSFNYGQRHLRELESARQVAQAWGAQQHITITVNLREIGGSALTAPIAVPKGRYAPDMGPEIPITYVPARNAIFLSFALAWAEVLGAADIFIGVNQLDYSGYPDCRPEFIQAFSAMANLATKAGVEGRLSLQIHTPLIHMTKADIIRNGRELGVDFGMTWSCYDPTPEGGPCRQCDSCLLRRKGFAEAGAVDPLLKDE